MKTKTAQPLCPECEKLVSVSEESNKIGGFIDWIMSRYDICEFVETDDDEDFVELMGYVPVRKSINQWLADYYKIDLHKVDQERKALLEWMREQDEN